MTTTTLAPFRIDPQFVSRVWGVTDLRPWFDFVSPADPVGEAWLTGDSCLVATGPHAGQTLSDLFRQAHALLLGPSADSPDSPLLLKVIFAREKLSVQVHPDDAMARKYGQPRGKTECWYALAATPESEVALGLLPGVTLAQIREGIHSGTLEQSLNLLPFAAGEMLMVDAGTVHAIWPGSIILETQQNCDVTYRMYDYGRPRELHIEKSLEAIKLDTRSGKVPPTTLPDRTVLVASGYFRVERIPVSGTRLGSTLPSPGESTPGLAYLFAAAGSGQIISTDANPAFPPVALPPRGIVAIPATSPAFAVEDLGNLDLIRITPSSPNPLE